MTTLIGNKPHQVPTNADLGGLAYQNTDYVRMGNVTVTGNLFTTNVVFTSNSVSPNVVTGNGYVSGNLIFTGIAASQRILGDFTTATTNQRLIFQTTTVDSSTGIYAIPNGTSQAASWQAANNSDTSSASKIVLAATATRMEIASGINGSGTYLPLSILTSGVEQLKVDTNGNLVVRAEAVVGSNVTVGGNLIFANTATLSYDANSAMPKAYTDTFSIVFGV